MKTTHEPCQYVAAEIGKDPNADVELLRQLPDVTAEIVGEIAVGALATLHRVSVEPPGRYAEPALKALACSACRLAGVCPVQERLQEDAQRFATMLAFARVFLERGYTELAGADWLDSGRRRRTGIDMEEALEGEPQIAHPEDETNILTLIDIDDLRKSVGDLWIREASPRVYTKAKLPEIQNISAIAEDKPLMGLVMMTRNDSQFVVVDARDSVNFTESPLSEREFANLCAKLVGRMVETGEDGKPLILSPDNTMQKVIARVDGGMVCEIRMSGKNRLYLTVCPEEDGSTRIVLLGAHGGDAATQGKFINTILPNQKRKL